MKKILLLFILIFSVNLQAQTLQNPTFGNTTTNTLKIKTPATVTSVNFLTTVETDKTIGQIDPILLPLTTATINAINVSDSNVLHKTGDESFTGIKSTINTGTGFLNGFLGTNNGTIGSYVFRALITSTGRGYTALNSNLGDSFYSDISANGNGFVSNATSTGSGNLFLGRNDGVPTFFVDKTGQITSDSETGNTIASFDGSKRLKSLPLATYPNFTELSYVKGVTSAIQGQINGKQNTLTNPNTGTGTTNLISKFTGLTTQGNSTISDNGTIVNLTNASAMLRGGDTTGRLIVSNSTQTSYVAFNGQTRPSETDNIDVVSSSGNINLLTGGSSRFRIFNSGGIATGGLTDPGLNNISIAGKATAGTAASSANDLMRKGEFDTSLALKADVTALPTSGNYTPTLTNISNVSTILLSHASYTRIGNTVTVQIGFTCVPVAGSLASSLSFTFPVNRSVSASNIIGSGGILDNSGALQSAALVQSVSTTTGQIKFVSQNTSLHFCSVTMQYSI